MRQRTIAKFGLIVIVGTVVTGLIYSIGMPPVIAKSNLASASASSNQTVPKNTYVYYFPFIANGCTSSAVSPVNWDPRLGPGGLSPLQNVRIIPALMPYDRSFWRIVIVKFQDIFESGNDHTIYVQVIDENCNRVTGTHARFFGEGSGEVWFEDEKSATDPCNCNFAASMWGDSYSVYIDDVIPSDTMAGMIMPMRRHVNYRITFQRVSKP